MGKIKVFLVVLLILAAIVFGLRVFKPQTDISPINDIAPTESSIVTPTNDSLQQYRNPDLGFSLSHSKDTRVNPNLDNTVSFYQWGPTQKIATELFDGFSVNISQGNLGANKDLKSLAEADLVQKKEQLSPDFKLITPISDTNGTISFKTEEMFGEVDYYYLPQDAGKFLLLSVMIRDPQNLGFANQVQTLIQSITMIKEE